MLAIKVRTAFIQFNNISAHAPSGSYSRDEQEDWWTKLAEIQWTLGDDIPTFVLADTSAHLATTVEGNIGTPLHRKQNVPAEIMLEYLEVVNQALPSTYGHLNT